LSDSFLRGKYSPQLPMVSIKTGEVGFFEYS
jgi:hypothetical protein